MNRIRTAPAIVGLLLVPATLLLGGFSAAYAEDGPVEVCASTPAPAECDTPPVSEPTPNPEPTDGPTDGPTDEPTPIAVDDTCMHPDAVATEDGCVILGPPPVADIEDGHTGVVGPAPHYDPPPRPEGQADADSTSTGSRTAEPAEIEAGDPQLDDVDPPVVTLETEQLAAHSGDAPDAVTSGPSTGVRVGVGLGLALAALGGTVLLRRTRNG